MKVVTDACDGLIVLALAQIEECLEADDYVDRLRTMFEPKQSVECKGGAGVD
ncbi:hypothetical protein Hanom_Chr09g00767961 [Helianthus anomalus]